MRFPATIMVSFDREKLERLKVSYGEAVRLNADSFRFDGNEYIVGYAKYLIEYLDSQLPPRS